MVPPAPHATPATSVTPAKLAAPPSPPVLIAPKTVAPALSAAQAITSMETPVQPANQKSSIVVIALKTAPPAAPVMLVSTSMLMPVLLARFPIVLSAHLRVYARNVTQNSILKEIVAPLVK